MSDNVKTTISILKDVLVVGTVIFGLLSGWMKLSAAPDLETLKQELRVQKKLIEDLRDTKVSLERYNAEQQYVRDELARLGERMDAANKLLAQISVQIARLEHSR